MVGQHRITQCLAQSADLCPFDLQSCYQPFVVLSETCLSSEGEIFHLCVPQSTEMCCNYMYSRTQLK